VPEAQAQEEEEEEEELRARLVSMRVSLHCRWPKRRGIRRSRKHTMRASVSIRRHTAVYVSIRQRQPEAATISGVGGGSGAQVLRMIWLTLTYADVC
jgi:hypothetical protein